MYVYHIANNKDNCYGAVAQVLLQSATWYRGGVSH